MDLGRGHFFIKTIKFNQYTKLYGKLQALRYNRKNQRTDWFA